MSKGKKVCCLLLVCEYMSKNKKVSIHSYIYVFFFFLVCGVVWCATVYIYGVVWCVGVDGITLSFFLY